MQIPQGSFFLEIFAGQAGLSRAISARGIPILPPIEIEVNDFVKQSVDVLDPQVQEHLRRLIQAGVIFYIHFGTPCSSFSVARKNDGGPPPLRDRQHLWGLPGLRPRDQMKVTMGTKFMFFTQKLAVLCSQRHVLWSVENPASSFLWLMPPILELGQLPHVFQVTLDMCRFGSPHKKPTSLMSVLDLGALALQCDMVERPHQHDPLVGTITINNRKIFRTKLAQVYPDALCAAWAEQVVVHQQADPLAATFALVTPAADRKRPVGQPVPWAPHKQRATAEKATAAGYQLKRSALPPLLLTEMEPGQAVAAALQVQHPFTLDPALDPDLQEALAMVVRQPEWVLGHRAGALQRWEARAISLLPATDNILKTISDPFLRRLLRGQPDGRPLQLGLCTHVALWQELLSEAQCVDRALLHDLVHGFSIVGPIQRSGRWHAMAGQDISLPLQDLRSRAWEFSQKVIKNVMRCEVTEHTAKIWEATMEDVAEGSTCGPFFSRQEVSAFLGTEVWIPTQRFEVVQKNKVRGVDSATVNGVNVATVITEKLELPSTNVNVAALRWLRSHLPSGTSVHGWVLDERKAYRQIMSDCGEA